ncbi:RDD family protein [Marinomonas ostreistagni]|uniref:RDD family protein n=1 Tax=Marinomonas ostreistagni TaxID=359209 RepID=UPI00194E101D|nr:RDD family protein [Marinomonas ostreistagni]MBM6552222.1 RDD family protein [Marinomonas ostreistagni]
MQQKVQLWRRLAAAFYDSLLLIALYFVVGWIAVMANDGEAVEAGWLFWLLLLIAWGFFVKFWRYPGQTLGMQVWKFRLVQTDGTQVTLRQATARYLLALVSWACAGLGFWWALLDKDGATWHDKLTDTRLEFIDHKKRDP